MEKIRTLIVDDETLAREGIRSRLELDPAIEIIGECPNGNKAVISILRDTPDLVFLDIQMPKLDGFGVIEIVGAARMPQVIFVTAFDKYAVKAFEIHALDYLLKPVDKRRFASALARAKSLIYGKNGELFSQQLTSLLGSLKSDTKYLERLAIKVAGSYLLINVADINWIEADDNYVKLHTADQIYLMHITMTSLEESLDPDAFLRIHRSAIVNLRKVKELHSMFHGKYEVVLDDGTRLTSGKVYRESIQRLLGIQ